MLNWITGNIGFHHVHHLNPRIPNYRLAECHHAVFPHAAELRALTLSEAAKSWRFALWDEATGRMCTVQEAEQMAPGCEAQHRSIAFGSSRQTPTCRGEVRRQR
jgi:omega-6 fatty acid desaturase (delta-12 desaturase)